MSQDKKEELHFPVNPVFEGDKGAYGALGALMPSVTATDKAGDRGCQISGCGNLYHLFVARGHNEFAVKHMEECQQLYPYVPAFYSRETIWRCLDLVKDILASRWY